MLQLPPRPPKAPRESSSLSINAPRDKPYLRANEKRCSELRKQNAQMLRPLDHVLVLGLQRPYDLQELSPRTTAATAATFE